MTPVAALGIVYLALNIVTYLLYFADKRKAVEGKWRIRESTLLVAGFIGPFGAVAGMRMFHHKTQKPKFKINYLFLMLHLVGLLALLTYYS